MPKKLEITFDMAKNIANEKFNGKYSYDKFSFKNMTTKALVEFIKNEYNSSIESYINPKKTNEEIKGNKYNIWNCGFINFKAYFSF